MNELTITLTGKTAVNYLRNGKFISMSQAEYDNLLIDYETLEIRYNYALHTIDELTTETTALKDQVVDLTNQLTTATNNLKVLNSEAVLDRAITDANTTIQHMMDKYITDNSEKDTTISEVIEPNPVTFPAITNNKPKSGTHWTEDELSVVKRSLESNYTLAFLKVKLSNRSEAAIRSMLLNYNIGVKNNKLYAK